MPRVWSTIKSQDGFSLVEVLLAAVVFGFLVTGLVGAIVYGRASSASAGDRARAVYLAEEGIEATRNIGTAAYANLVDCASGYGLTQSGSPLTWAFLACGTPDTSGIYTRKVVIATASTNRKSITSTVTWPQPGGTTGTVTLTSQLTNWQANLKLWSNTATPVSPAVNDITGTNNAIKTATQGNFAYSVLNIVTTNNFVVTNLTNPAAPTSAVFSIAGTPTNIFVVGNYAYVTNQLDTAELQVIDITNPAAPTVVKSVDMTSTGNGQGVYVSNGYAYVVRAADATAGANELTIVNVSTPASAAVVGGYNNDIAMNEVYVSGTNVYIATSSLTQEMLRINAANPAAPVLGSTYNPTTPNLAATTIDGYGNTILLGMRTTLDAVNATTLARFGTFTAAGAINDIDIDTTNQFAFLATASTTGEFQVVNIANTAAMALTKTVDVTGVTSTLGGVSYATALDVVVGASAADTQEIMVFNRN